MPIIHDLTIETNSISLMRLIDPRDLYHLCEKLLWRRSFIKNSISQWLTSTRDVKISNSSSIKSTRTTRHESHETWDVYEHVRLEIPEASEGWGAKKHVRHDAQATRESTKHKTCEIQEYVRHVRHEST